MKNEIYLGNTFNYHKMSYVPPIYPSVYITPYKSWSWKRMAYKCNDCPVCYDTKWKMMRHCERDHFSQTVIFNQYDKSAQFWYDMLYT